MEYGQSNLAGIYFYSLSVHIFIFYRVYQQGRKIMILNEVLLPEGFPAAIAEYQWFLKCMDSPEWFLAVRLAAALVIVFVGSTYFYYSRKDKKKQEEEY